MSELVQSIVMLCAGILIAVLAVRNEYNERDCKDGMPFKLEKKTYICVEVSKIKTSLPGNKI